MSLVYTNLKIEDNCEVLKILISSLITILVPKLRALLADDDDYLCLFIYLLESQISYVALKSSHAFKRNKSS